MNTNSLRYLYAKTIAPGLMSILSPAIKGIMKLRQSAIDNFMLNPVDTQMQVFHRLIGSAQWTEFGKAHGFEQINTIADFQAAVPIHDYDSLKPFMQRVMEGHQNVIWPSDINWFAKSSGTTSDKSKFIPVSRETMDENHFKAGKDVLALNFRAYPDSRITAGKCLTIGGSHQVNQLNEDSFYGDLSAVMMVNMPLTGQILRTPDPSIALMDEWESKIETMAHATLHDNVTFIAGVPTWTLVLIKRIFELAGTDNLLDVWPNLELYIHGGVSFKPYRQQFETIIPSPDMHYLETYNASEGFFAAQDTPDPSNGMLLFLNHGIFYEFVPVEEFGKEDAPALTLKEVELGKRYAMVITTNSGLYRYAVGDTVQFTSLYPFRIRVVGRIKSYINAFGEEVIAENSDEAIARACRETGALVADYTAAPVYMTGESNGAHEWIIEFEEAPPGLDAFVDAMDRALQEVNSDYQAKRYKDIALRRPIVHQMPRGGFTRWLKDKGKLGGQHKVPRLSNDRRWMDELLPYLKEESND